MSRGTLTLDITEFTARVPGGRYILELVSGKWEAAYMPDNGPTEYFDYAGDLEGAIDVIERHSDRGNNVVPIRGLK